MNCPAPNGITTFLDCTEHLPYLHEITPKTESHSFYLYLSQTLTTKFVRDAAKVNTRQSMRVRSKIRS